MAEFSLKGPTVTTSYTTTKTGKVVQVGTPKYSSSSSSRTTQQPKASTANDVALSPQESQTKPTSQTGVFVERTNSPIYDVKSGTHVAAGTGVWNLDGGRTATGGTSYSYTGNPYSRSGQVTSSKLITSSNLPSKSIQPSQLQTTQATKQDWSWAMSRPSSSVTQTTTHFGGLSIVSLPILNLPVERDASKSALGLFRATPLGQNIRLRNEQAGVSSFDTALTTGKLFGPLTTLSSGASSLITYGATSAFPALRQTQATATGLKLLDVRSTFGEQVQFGKQVATQQSTGFVFETGSFFKPTTTIVAQSVGKGTTTGNIFKEVGVVRLTTEGQKAQSLARASTTVFTPTKISTFGEFYSKTGKTIKTDPFASMGMEVGRVGELKQFNILTAQEARGVPYFSAERLTQTARVTDNGVTSTRYVSIGGGTSGKGITNPFMSRVGTEAKISASLKEVDDLKGVTILKQKIDTTTIQLQNPIAKIERMAGRSGMKAIQFEKGLFTGSQAIAGLSKTSLAQSFSFKTFQEQAIGQSSRGGFGSFQTTTPGTQQLFQLLVIPPTTLGVGYGWPVPTGRGLGPSPYIPPVLPFGGPGFELPGRTPKFSGFGAQAAKYIPNLRGLESGKIATRTTGIFTGAESRGITKDMAKALGYKTTTRRKK